MSKDILIFGFKSNFTIIKNKRYSNYWHHCIILKDYKIKFNYCFILGYFYLMVDETTNAQGRQVCAILAGSLEVEDSLKKPFLIGLIDFENTNSVNVSQAFLMFSMAWFPTTSSF